MGEATVQIIVKDRGNEKGWAYTHWILDLGKGQGPVGEDVCVVCAESSKHYMSREKAVEEAISRIKVKIERECGNLPDEKIRWVIKESM